MEERPRTNLNGGDLVPSTFLVLTFAFALALMATQVQAQYTSSQVLGLVASRSPINRHAVDLTVSLDGHGY